MLDVGKTTLVHSILKGQHGLKIAVIMNEFGEEQELEKEMFFQTEVVLELHMRYSCILLL